MTFTTDEQGFLNAILDAPDDDAPKLVYADWLDENGHDERAEFIKHSPALKWWRKSYGKWVWWQEYKGGGTPFWNDCHNSWRYVDIAKILFPQSWRCNLNHVIFRRGFVSELGVKRFYDCVFRLLETQPVTTLTTNVLEMLRVISLFGNCASLNRICITRPLTACSTEVHSDRTSITFHGEGQHHPATVAVPYVLGDSPRRFYGVAECDYFLGRIVAYYLTTHGITVEMPRESPQ